MKDFLSHYKLLIFAVIMLVISWLLITRHHALGPSEAPIPAPILADENSIGGIGIIEPASENIDIGTFTPGIVKQVYVTAGQQVKKGEPLFTIDDRDTKARLTLAKAKLESALVQLSDANYQSSLYEKVSDKRAISVEELKKRSYAAQLAQTRVLEAEAEIHLLETSLDLLTVKSTLNGRVLKVNIHAGEFAEEKSPSEPLLVLGNTKTMHVRVEIDETDALRLTSDSKAMGYIRGYTKEAIPLFFIRTEPLIATKKTLNNASSELIDTRVLQIIYAFDNKKLGAYVGQHMDVFISAKPVLLRKDIAVPSDNREVKHEIRKSFLSKKRVQEALSCTGINKQVRWFSWLKETPVKI